MKAEVIRKPMSFRLRTDIVDILRAKAARANRTLNNYVESLLIENALEDQPNDITLASLREAQEMRANNEPTYRSVSEMMAELTKE